MKSLIIFLSFALTTSAWAAGNTLKQIDNIQNSTGGSSLSVPGTGTTLVTDSNTVTLTNKSISGSQITSGTVAVGQGGTGASSFTSNGILYGNTTSPLQVTAAGTQYQSLQAGSGGVPAFDAIHLNQSAAITGTLPVGNGGTGQSSLTVHGVVIGNSTSGVNVTSAGTAGQVLTSNGPSADPTYQAVPMTTPSLNGGSASPQSVTAAGGVSLSSIGYFNYAWLVGSPGAVTVTATPSVTACTADGQELKLIGTSNTNTVKLQDEASLAGSKLRLNGPVTLGLYQDVTFHCDVTLGDWVEDNRNY